MLAVPARLPNLDIGRFMDTRDIHYHEYLKKILYVLDRDLSANRANLSAHAMRLA